MTADLPSFTRPILALAGAGIAAVVDTVTPAVPGVPPWVTSLGMPVAFLVAAVYGLIATNRALRESEAGRRSDWEKFSAKLENLAEKSNDTRERLIRSSDMQTVAFEKLAESIKSQMHQKP